MRASRSAPSDLGPPPRDAVHSPPSWPPLGLALRSTAVAAALVPLLACVGSRTSPPDDTASITDGGVAPACGTSHCESTLWPRLAVVFGDAEAASLSYTFTFPDRTLTWTPDAPYDVGFCPAGYGESSAYRCDIGIDTSPVQALLVTVTVRGASIDIPLQPFNYCGIGMAELVVSVDHGSVSFGPVRYVNPCGE